MTYRGPFLPVKFLALIVLVTFYSGTAHAQWPTFARPNLVAAFYWEQRDVLLQGEHLDDDELRVGFEIQQTGYWYDPRIVAFNYYLRPAFSVLEFTPTGKQDAEYFNYRIGIDILRGAAAPVEVSLGSSLTDNEYKATLAGDSVSRTQQHTVELRWKFAPFPMQFTAIEQDYHRRSSSIFSESAFERDDLFRKFRIRGRSSKLSLFLEHETRESRTRGRGTGFENDTARLTHRFHWGKNSRLDTRYNYRRREQDREYITNSFNQYISVRHIDNLNSTLNYRFEVASGVLDSNLLDVSYSLNHQLYRNLGSSIFLYTSDVTSENAGFTERGAGLKFDYRKDFFGTEVKLGAGHRRSNIDRNTEEGFLETIDEAYTIPLDGTLLLSSRLIDRDSVTITDVGGTILYIEGIDYNLLDFGDGLLIVGVIPGGEIETEQSVLISYLATLNPSGEYRETVSSYDMTIRRGGWFFSHRALRTDNDLIDGVLPSGLQNRWESHTSVNHSRKLRKAEIHMGATKDAWRQTDFNLDSLTFSVSATMPLSQSANASLTLTHQESETEELIKTFEAETGSDRLDSDSDNLRLDVNWRVTGNFTITPSLIAWRRDFEYEQDQFRSFSERVVSAAVDFDYRFRRFSANLRLFYNDWEVRQTRPNVDSLRTDDGFHLTVRRSF